ncbi:hypothetical protein OROMI_031404 [Orobanche minor]
MATTACKHSFNQLLKVSDFQQPLTKNGRISKPRARGLSPMGCCTRNLRLYKFTQQPFSLLSRPIFVRLPFYGSWRGLAAARVLRKG